jgi:hypothetical protein
MKGMKVSWMNYLTVYVTLLVFNAPVIKDILFDELIPYKRLPYLTSVYMLIVNIIMVILLTVRIICNKVVYISGFNQDDFNVLCISVVVLFLISAFLIWNRRRTGLLKEDDIDKKYIKFTAQAKGGIIRCFARELSFLGKIFEPGKCLKEKEERNYLKNIMLCNNVCDIPKKECKNIDAGLSCAMACGQFTQLLKMKNNMEKLEILCVKPKDKYSKALLGKLIHSFRDKFEVRLCDENIRDGIYMYARIIITSGPSPMIWHWKIGDKYSKTQKYHRSEGGSLNAMSVLGETLFYLVKTFLWDSYHGRKTEEREFRKEWLTAFYDVIGLNEEERTWEE